jgi:hypothetical protein
VNFATITLCVASQQMIVVVVVVVYFIISSVQKLFVTPLYILKELYHKDQICKLIEVI